MSVTIKNIIPPKIIETAQTSQYTAVGVKCIIDKLTVTNISTQNASVSLYLVPNLDVAGNSNLIVKSQTLSPNETYSFYELVGQVLENGGQIITTCTNTNALNLTASGREVS